MADDMLPFLAARCTIPETIMLFLLGKRLESQKSSAPASIDVQSESDQQRHGLSWQAFRGAPWPSGARKDRNEDMETVSVLRHRLL